MKINVKSLASFELWEDVGTHLRDLRKKAVETGEVLEVVKEYEPGDPAFKKDDIYQMPFPYTISTLVDKVTFVQGNQERVMKDRNGKET